MQRRLKGLSDVGGTIYRSLVHFLAQISNLRKNVLTGREPSQLDEKIVWQKVKI